MPIVGNVPCGELEQEIVSMTASAMFGVPGPEAWRGGPKEVRKPRTLGIGWLLYAFVRASRPKMVVEVGTGGSTACVLWALKHNEMGHIHTCDVFASGDTDDNHAWVEDEKVVFYKEPDGQPMNHNKATVLRMILKWGMGDIVTIHHESSKDFVPRWSGPIDMVVVDGNHGKDFLENDIQLLKHLVPGGYALFHDFTACVREVGETILDWVNASNEWALIVEPSCLSMAIIQRKWTLSMKECWTAAYLASSANPNGMNTPFQMTDPRTVGAIKEWKGEWFPPMDHLHDSQPEGIEIAKKIIAWEQNTGKTLERMEDLFG